MGKKAVKLKERKFKHKKTYGGDDTVKMKNGKPITATGERNCGTRGNGSQPGAGAKRR